MRRGATIAPIPGVQTLRHSSWGELLKCTVATELGSWTPGLLPSPPPGVSTVLMQSSPSPSGDVVGGQDYTGGHCRTPWGCHGQNRSPVSRVDWCQPASSDKGRRRSAGARLGQDPLPAILPGMWSMMGTLERVLGSPLWAQMSCKDNTEKGSKEERRRHQGRLPGGGGVVWRHPVAGQPPNPLTCGP